MASFQLSTVQGQSNTLSPATASFTAIIVADMDVALDWYSKVVQLEIINQQAVESRGIRQANLSNGSLQVELIEISSSVDPASLTADKVRFQGLFKFGVNVDQFDKWLEHLNQNEVTFNGDVVTDVESGKRMVVVLDPDGNRIQFFEK